MISTRDYFGSWYGSPLITPVLQNNCMRLLSACNKLEAMMLQDKVKMPTNIKTKSQISGDKLGGFRPKGNGIGAGDGSSHCDALGVDRYDPSSSIDDWCMANSGKGGKLEQCGIYLEHPSKTEGWSHWTIRPPASGKRVFMP